MVETPIVWGRFRKQLTDRHSSSVRIPPVRHELLGRSPDLAWKIQHEVAARVCDEGQHGVLPWRSKMGSDRHARGLPEVRMAISPQSMMWPCLVAQRVLRS